MKHLQRHTAKQWWELIKRSVSAWSDDYAPSMGAALSYYSVFSMAPLLLLVVSIAGMVFGEDAARGQLFMTLKGMMGSDAADALQGMLAAMSKPSHNIAGSAISIGVLVVGATSVFGELQDALDRIWRAPDRVKSAGIWGLLRSRVLSFGMILGIAFLLMVSLVTTAAVSALGKWWGGFFGDWEVLLHLVNFMVGFLLTAGGFASIYKFMPRVRVQWHDVWWGAAITALLFTVGKSLIGLYIGKTGVASGFGAAGSVAIVFVWVYYSAQIFLLGAEFTWIYAQTFGSRQGIENQKSQKPTEHSADIAPDAAPVPSHLPSDVFVQPARSSLASIRDSAPPLVNSPASKAKLLNLGFSLAAAVSIKYILPKLLLRLAAGKGGRKPV